MQGSKSFRRLLGRSVEGRDQILYTNVDPEKCSEPVGLTLLIGGMHGDEPATVLLLEDFLSCHLGSLAEPVAILPICNPDGYIRHSRYNARGIDLNRNCAFNWHVESIEPSGPSPWSEPETRGLRDYILSAKPARIVSLHWALAEIDADGHHSTALAQAMWESLTEAERRPYRLRVTELGRGQRRLQEIYTNCPGSLGQWCGYALEYPGGIAPAMITLELPYDPEIDNRPDELPDDHLTQLHARWADDPEGYLQAVRGPVHKMLLAACRFITA